MDMWHITGAHANTGQTKTILIEAEDEQGALAEAKKRGLFVSNLQRIGTMETKITAIEYRTPPTPAATEPGQASPPSYSFMQTTATLIGGLGVFCMLMGVLVILVGVATLRPATLFAGISSLVGGLLWAGLGESIRALRDIARNSWHR